MMLLPFNKPEEGISTGLTQDDIINELNKVDDDKEPVKEPDDDNEEIKLKDGEEEIVEDEEETKLKLDDEEDEEKIAVPDRRKDILKEYPALFKKFPFLEKSLYKAQQYSEVFPTPNEAKEAKDRLENYDELETKATTLDKLEKEVLSGNSEPILRAVRHNDPEGFNKLVDNYLPTLARVDKEAHLHVVSNVIRDVIMTMKNVARNDKDENLDAAADIVNRFIFATTQVVPPQKLSTGEVKKDDTLEIERQKFAQEQFETKRDSLNDKVENTLKSTINDYIDPNGVMTDYVKKNAVEDALKEVYNLIETDSLFSKTLDDLWKRAFENKFDKSSLDKIRNAFLSKAKTHLRPAIQKSRNTALKGLGQRKQEKDKDKEVVRSGRSTALINRDNSSRESSKKVPAGMSTFDFLNQD